MQIIVRVDSDLRDALNAAAREASLSTQLLIEQTLRRSLRRRGQGGDNVEHD